MTRAGAALAILGQSAGCLWDNPAFGGQAVSDSASGSGTTTATTATSGAPTTSAGSTGEATGTTSAGVTGDVSSGTGGTTTGGPVDCWDNSLESWTIEPVTLKDAAARSPTLSPDGLNLYYHGPHDGELGVFRVPRGSPGDPFPTEGALFHFEPGLKGLDYPAVRAGEQELFFMQGDPGDIYVAHKVAEAWQAAAIAGGFQLFGGDKESHPNITADGALLLFQREDGPPVGALMESWNFYQAQRDPQMATFPDVAPTLVTPTGNFFDPVCPALSPDGLHLFFAASDSAPQMAVDELNDGRVGVWYGHRAATTDPGWEVSKSTVLRAPDVITCPTSVTADGCQVTLVQFRLDVATYAILLARRG